MSCLLTSSCLHIFLAITSPFVPVCPCLRFQLACWSYGELLELSIQRRNPRQPSQQIQGAFHKTPVYSHFLIETKLLKKYCGGKYLKCNIWEQLLSSPSRASFGSEITGYVWQVTNVDDEGNELGSGTMELTQTELILHTRKRDAIRWPYLCLRRYGYDSNLFSFESGRRCQTGQGEMILISTLCRCKTELCVKQIQKPSVNP